MDEYEGVRYRALTEKEIELVQRCRPALLTKRIEPRVAYVVRGGEKGSAGIWYTIAFVKSDSNVYIGVAKRNKIDPFDHGIGENVAFARALRDVPIDAAMLASGLLV